MRSDWCLAGRGSRKATRFQQGLSGGPIDVMGKADKSAGPWHSVWTPARRALGPAIGSVSRTPIASRIFSGLSGASPHQYNRGRFSPVSPYISPRRNGSSSLPQVRLAKKYTPRFTVTNTSAYPPASQQRTLFTAASADSLTSLAGTLTIWAPMISLIFQPKPLFFP